MWQIRQRLKKNKPPVILSGCLVTNDPELPTLVTLLKLKLAQFHYELYKRLALIGIKLLLNKL